MEVKSSWDDLTFLHDMIEYAHHFKILPFFVRIVTLNRLWRFDSIVRQVGKDNGLVLASNARLTVDPVSFKRREYE